MRKDILLNEQNEILIVDGDFVIGQSDQQHVKHIVEAFKGEYKSNPLVGFGVINYLKRDEMIESEFKRDLKIQLTSDGYQDPIIDLTGGFEQLKINI
ncbi:oxidase [Amniculibacterium sp. G2-70]|uniref:oxidase n=1 Tax=Amniculibacterium sp. G2-70 TaxID=2767188 RepID=UPI00165477E9|nr:oxidase [Amniculibacterium sp. G2-70]